MNAPNTQLDPFETALLTELRTHVATRTPARRPRHVRRWAVGLAAAGVAATAVVVTGLGGGTLVGTAPAYAVEQTGDGDVVVTINRFEDAAGLESALAENGIEATVTFDPQDEEGVTSYPLGPDGGTLGPVGIYINEDGRPCERLADTVLLTALDQGWELRFPAGSPVLDRPVAIITSADEAVALSYVAQDPEAVCVVRKRS